MKKEVIHIIGKILAVSSGLILLIAIIFYMLFTFSGILHSSPEKSSENVFEDVLLGILFSAGFIMGIISIVYSLYKGALLDIFSKEDSANKPK